MDRAVHPAIAATLAQPGGDITMNLVMGEQEIPMRYRGLRLADYQGHHKDARRAARAAEEFVLGFRDRYVTPRRPIEEYPTDRSLMGRGLLFNGPAGTGKTTLAVTTLVEVLMRLRVKTYYMPFPTWVSLRTESFALAGRTDDGSRTALWKAESRLEKAADAPLLLLDDVGNEHTGRSDFPRNDFARLLRERHAACKPTLITTNVPSLDNGWQTAFGDATASFLRQACEVLAMDAVDGRR